MRYALVLALVGFIGTAKGDTPQTGPSDRLLDILAAQELIGYSVNRETSVYELEIISDSTTEFLVPLQGYCTFEFRRRSYLDEPSVATERRAGVLPSGALWAVAR